MSDKNEKPRYRSVKVYITDPDEIRGGNIYVNSVRYTKGGLQPGEFKLTLNGVSSPPELRVIGSDDIKMEIRPVRPAAPSWDTIIKPPGLYTDRLLRTVLSAKMYGRVFKQIVLDMQQEHAEAIVHGDQRLARRCHIRGLCAIAVALVVAAYTFVNKVKRAAE